ncbi:phosphoglucosamine mutase [Bacteroidales bacterium OttesenSCG-928-K03]|nr:phosphoglucosamine mutase [Odoribacter sp. OttesenSCG-928-L07]MDL2242634.1 phosphoglucosamine mutase [Bacteroidales bacterium OttesenSCG-928-K03]
MTLISSISGIRGTIGGVNEDCLSPLDIVKYTSAYALTLKEKKDKPKIIVGRDGRITGDTVQNLIINTLKMCGVNVMDCGLTTTPTIEIAIPYYNTDGGIMISASHNPMNWNALKLFNEKGEFIDGNDGKRIKTLVDKSEFEYVKYEDFGIVELLPDVLELHVKQILELPYIKRNLNKIKNSEMKIAVDGINSTGGFAVPYLLKQLGIKTENIFELNCMITGEFAHVAEPLEKNLVDLSQLVVAKNCDFGIAVDPDVDRLALMSENGDYFGEEYTLVACADFILQNKLGNTVSNLSSSRALKDLTEQFGCKYFASAVGEVNVVEKMKEVNAVVGGEGNGGIILPELHYGRDALVGIALIISYLVESNKKMSELKKSYPQYFMEKDKVDLQEGINLNNIKKMIKDSIKSGDFNEIDGIKIDFEDSWVHVRTSNTEPIARIYSEAKTLEKAQALVKEIKDIIEN